MNLQEINCVVFDFGNVLIDLNYQSIIEGFRSIANKNADRIEQLVVTDPMLQDFERGDISPEGFRKNVCEFLDIDTSPQIFDQLWNSVLHHLPKGRLEQLFEIGKYYKTYILSNTNWIHEQAFNTMILETTGYSSLHDFVDKCYLSHKIGRRKPDLSCFQWMIEDIGKPAQEMLFLDDRLDNVEIARMVGMHAVQITDPQLQFEELFR